MKYLICNLKSNKTLNEIGTYEHELRKIPKNTNRLVICPSTPFLGLFQNDNYELGAQDVSKFENGSYTGEVNAEQLKSLKVKYALIGHCERKAYFQEGEKDFIAKIKNCLNNGIVPIYIIGETKEEHDRKKTMIVLEKQIGRVLNEFTREDLKNVIIVYEPVWLVDNKEMMPAKELGEVIDFIKNILKEYYELNTPVLYGGGVNEKEFKNYQKTNLDGYLIGHSSLDVEVVSDIYTNL